ncbi:MAG: hypothetical protein ABIQ36_05245 [Rhodanobacter sp.]
MQIVLTIKEASDGLWRICSDETVLYDRLRFAHAIRLARGLAREKYANSGQEVSVDMVCAGFTIALMQQACSASSRQAAA